MDPPTLMEIPNFVELFGNQEEDYHLLPEHVKKFDRMLVAHAMHFKLAMQMADKEAQVQFARGLQPKKIKKLFGEMERMTKLLQKINKLSPWELLKILKSETMKATEQVNNGGSNEAKVGTGGGDGGNGNGGAEPNRPSRNFLHCDVANQRKTVKALREMMKVAEELQSFLTEGEEQKDYKEKMAKLHGKAEEWENRLKLLEETSQTFEEFEDFADTSEDDDDSSGSGSGTSSSGSAGSSPS